MLNIKNILLEIKQDKKDTKVTSSHEFIIFSWNSVCEICKNVIM